MNIATPHTSIEVETPVESVMDWGMLGYFIGDVVEENIPVLTGAIRQADPLRHKHFGAAAASSGGVELYHIVGVTPEARDFGDGARRTEAGGTIQYGHAERRRVYETLNANGRDPNVDFVMLGCPHASIEQFREVARLLDGKKIKTHLWMFTSRAVKTIADMSGFTKAIEDAGGAGDDRYLLGDRARGAQRHQGSGARFGEAVPLSAGDGGRGSVVRHHRRLHPRGRDRALGGRIA